MLYTNYANILKSLANLLTVLHPWKNRSLQPRGLNCCFFLIDKTARQPF